MRKQELIEQSETEIVTSQTMNVYPAFVIIDRGQLRSHGS